MAKLTDKLKAAFKKLDTTAGSYLETKQKAKAVKSIGPSMGQYKAFKAGQKTKSFLKGAGKLGKVARFARAATPYGLAFEGGRALYKIVPKTKAENKAVQKAHNELANFTNGGETMLKEVPADKKKSLGKLPEKVRNKMGYAKQGKMMKAKMGMEAKSTKGYGAARTSGMGLQDENLIPGKSMDYYKDLM